jgi:hypothetical protein
MASDPKGSSGGLRGTLRGTLRKMVGRQDAEEGGFSSDAAVIAALRCAVLMC